MSDMSKIELLDLSKLTPMMQQYYELKALSAPAILFFRMGDFYEIFAQDAELSAPLLDIVLTSRERGDATKIPFCGVPHHSAQGYWLKLLRLGYKVAIADQVEDPAQAKGIVKREITRIFSPGSIDELAALEPKAPNYIAAVYEVPKERTWHVAFADVSTGELRFGDLKDLTELRFWIERFRPKELICRKFCEQALRDLLKGYLSKETLLFSNFSEAFLQDINQAKEFMGKTLSKAIFASELVQEKKGNWLVVAALLHYLASMKATLKQFLALKPLKDSKTMLLDDTVVRDLELFETQRLKQASGSFIKQIDYTKTAMGARLLRWNLCEPLLDGQQIQTRHESVDFLLGLGEDFLAKISKDFNEIADLERLATRAAAKNIKPHEIAKVSASLKACQKISLILQEITDPPPLLLQLSKEISAYNAILALLETVLCENPTELGHGDGIFKKGYDPELDEFNTFSKEGEERVEAYSAALRKASGISSLKIKFHKTFGLVIEITKSNLSKVPKNFIRRQTMVNCERFVTSELKDLDETLNSAKDKAIAREEVLYLKLLEELYLWQENLKNIAKALALLDLLLSFAYLSKKRSFSRAQISSNSVLYLQGARHPVVESFVGEDNFVANDVYLDSAAKQMLITGPNMAGKSTIMRLSALCAILNQIGCFVPARTAKLPLFDRIFTRVGAGDDLSSGMSTFMMEMSEASHILRHATADSLVILDEVGRGTSTGDGLAIAAAILKYLHEKINCWAMFATHYHELVPLAQDMKRISLMQTEVLEKKDGVVFTHRLVSGASGNSFGLEVAELAGMPPEVLERARGFLQQGTKPQKSSSSDFLQEAAFSKEHGIDPVYSKLSKVKLNRITPAHALQILSELKGLSEKRNSLFASPMDGFN